MNYWDMLYRPLMMPAPQFEGWKITYTTNTTAPQDAERGPTYTDGFDDGWNANDATRGAR